MIRLLVVPALVFAATPVLAHTGAGDVHSLAGGLAHPLNGLDHMLAAFGVGLWAALSNPRRALLWPALFVAAMALSAVAAAQGLRLPISEVVLAASVVLIGGLITFRVHAGTLIGALIIVAIAVVHGHAHGAEGGAAPAYLTGLIVATAALHAAGIAVGMLALSRNATRVAQAAGVIIAAAGLWLTVAA